ncbi:hypothetical protein ACIA48_24065 [Mycobacterium sp. NPDC051804]|uniref:hypothetical protein n=1 Tax=Mycobacterium sp. NPDC051804 TaxID=3364295 RepID=UPI0037B67DA8
MSHDITRASTVVFNAAIVGIAGAAIALGVYALGDGLPTYISTPLPATAPPGSVTQTFTPAPG